jgi:hypothetical protein
VAVYIPPNELHPVLPDNVPLLAKLSAAPGDDATIVPPAPR